MKIHTLTYVRKGYDRLLTWISGSLTNHRYFTNRKMSFRIPILRREVFSTPDELKNKELTTNVMCHIKKNELINNVAERMLPENQNVVNEIILDFQREGYSVMWTLAAPSHWRFARFSHEKL